MKHFYKKIEKPFIIILSIFFIFVLFSSNFIVNAEELEETVFISDLYGFSPDNIDIGSGLTLNGFNNSSIYQEISLAYPSFAKGGNGLGNTYQLFINGNNSLKLKKEYVIDGVTYNIEDFPYFVLCASSPGSGEMSLLLCDSTFEDDYFIYCGFAGTLEGTILRFVWNAGDSSVPGVFNVDSYVPTVINSYPLGDVVWWQSQYPLVSNMDNLTTCRVGTSSSGTNTDYLRRIYASEGHGVKINYMLYDAEGNMNYENPILNGGDSDIKSNVEKGLYLLKGSCIYLENKSFNEGTLKINALLSDDQKNNPNLKLAIRANCNYSFEKNINQIGNKDIYFSNSSGVSSLNSILFNGVSSGSADIPSTQFGYIGFETISFDKLTNGTYSDSFSNINSKLFISTDLGSTSFYGNNIKLLASTLDTYNKSNFKVESASISVSPNISFTIANLDDSKQNTIPIVSACTYHFELYVIDDSNPDDIQWSDIIYSYDADLINGSRYVGTDATLTYSDLDSAFGGDTPSQYLPSDELSNDNYYSEGGSASSSSGGNSQVVNVTTNDSGKYVPGLIEKLLPGVSGDGGLSEDFQQMSNSNGWIQFMKNTFSFVPVAFWDNLNIYFVVALGIVGIAFVLRIVLDLM